MIKNLLGEIENNIYISEEFLEKVDKETVIKGEVVKFVNDVLLFSFVFFNLVYKSVESGSKIKKISGGKNG